MRKLIYILLTVPSLGIAQQVNFEQTAFDYFFDKVFEAEYPNVKTIQFHKSTAEELTEFGLLTDCFDKKDSVWAKLFDNAHGKTLSKKSIDITKVTDVNFKNRRVKSKLRMYVLQATKTEDGIYVAIGLIKQYHFTHAYFFEMDLSGNVVRWCKTGMTH